MRIFLTLLLPICLAAGCGGGLGQVTGTVTYEGKELEQGTIVFETKGARPATGRIEKGKIVEVTTSKPNDGLALGSHKVAIFAVEIRSSAPKNPGDPSVGTDAMNAPSLIPTLYNNPETSGLTAEIKSGANEVRYDLKKK